MLVPIYLYIMCVCIISLYHTHAEASCAECTTIAVASVTGTFIIAFILGTSFGVIAHRSTLNKQSYSLKSSEDQNLPLESVCATVSVPIQKKAIELQESFVNGAIEQN